MPKTEVKNSPPLQKRSDILSGLNFLTPQLWGVVESYLPTPQEEAIAPLKKSIEAERDDFQRKIAELRSRWSSSYSFYGASISIQNNGLAIENFTQFTKVLQHLLRILVFIEKSISITSNQFLLLAVHKANQKDKSIITAIDTLLENCQCTKIPSKEEIAKGEKQLKGNQTGWEYYKKLLPNLDAEMKASELELAKLQQSNQTADEDDIPKVVVFHC